MPLTMSCTCAFDEAGKKIWAEKKVKGPGYTWLKDFPEAWLVMDPEKAVGFVFNAHRSRPIPEYEDANGHGRTLGWRHKGETS